MPLVGFAGGLRCSEIVDLGRDQTQDGRGWVEILDKGLVVTLRGKTGWREVEIGRGSSDATCPVVALETWLKFARLVHGPIFRRVTGSGVICGTAPRARVKIERFVRRERCGHMSGLLVRSPTAGLDEVREAGGVSIGRAIGALTHRPLSPADFVPVRLHRSSAPYPSCPTLRWSVRQSAISSSAVMWRPA